MCNFKVPISQSSSEHEELETEVLKRVVALGRNDFLYVSVCVGALCPR